MDNAIAIGIVLLALLATGYSLYRTTMRAEDGGGCVGCGQRCAGRDCGGELARRQEEQGR